MDRRKRRVTRAIAVAGVAALVWAALVYGVLVYGGKALEAQR